VPNLIPLGRLLRSSEATTTLTMLVLPTTHISNSKVSYGWEVDILIAMLSPRVNFYPYIVTVFSRGNNREQS
jgi:hypothetical protein